MVEMGDYYLAECEEDLSILDFKTVVANAHHTQMYCGLLKQTEQDTTCEKRFDEV